MVVVVVVVVFVTAAYRPFWNLPRAIERENRTTVHVKPKGGGRDEKARAMQVLPREPGTQPPYLPRYSTGVGW